MKKMYLNLVVEEEPDKKFNYYYYDRIRRIIAEVLTNKPIGRIYLKERKHNYSVIEPHNLKFPYTVGMFKGDKLIGYYGTITRQNTIGGNKITDNAYFTSTGLTSLTPFLTTNQQRLLVTYKVIDIISKQVLPVKEVEKEIDPLSVLKTAKKVLKKKKRFNNVEIVGTQIVLTLNPNHHMNLTAKYSGRVVELKKDTDNYKQGTSISIDRIKCNKKDQTITIYLEDKGDLEPEIIILDCKNKTPEKCLNEYFLLK